MLTCRIPASKSAERLRIFERGMRNGRSDQGGLLIKNDLFATQHHSQWFPWRRKRLGHVAAAEGVRSPRRCIEPLQCERTTVGDEVSRRDSIQHQRVDKDLSFCAFWLPRGFAFPHEQKSQKSQRSRCKIVPGAVLRFKHWLALQLPSSSPPVRY